MTTDQPDTLQAFVAHRRELVAESRQLLDNEPRHPRLRWRRHARWRRRLRELPGEIDSLDVRIRARIAARDLFAEMRANVERDNRVPPGFVYMVPPGVATAMTTTGRAALWSGESPLRAVRTVMRACEDFAREAVLNGSVFVDPGSARFVPGVKVDITTGAMVQRACPPPSGALDQLQAEMDEVARIRLPQRDHPPCPECGGTFVNLAGKTVQVRRHMGWCPVVKIRQVIAEDVARTFEVPPDLLADRAGFAARFPTIVDTEENPDFRAFLDAKIREGLELARRIPPAEWEGSPRAAAEMDAWANDGHG